MDSKESRDCVQKVKSYLRDTLWVQVDENRWIFGQLVCFDYLNNIILEHSVEIFAESVETFSSSEQVLLGCCIIPGELVRRILVRNPSL